MIVDILERDVVICMRHGRDGSHVGGECCSRGVGEGFDSSERRATPKVTWMKSVMNLEW